jgi:4'-phosphopantetheinyl transferase
VAPAIEVQLWWALVDELEPQLAATEARLTADEAARHRGYYFERDRREFLARRTLEHTVLSHHAPARPRCNLSGSEGLVACVASTADVELGVDVEHVDHHAPRDWTLKEAYVKARGRGLAIPLDQVAFALDPAGPIGVTFDPRLADDEAWWELRQLQPIHDYVVAVAVRRPPGVTVALSLRRVP